jgi:hypothetical protein
VQDPLFPHKPTNVGNDQEIILELALTDHVKFVLDPLSIFMRERIPAFTESFVDLEPE